MMDERRLYALLDRFPQVRLLVVGDFFLDFYLDIDRALSELSIETGLEAYQVVQVRSSPGAAGTVASNLLALDVQVAALGVIGDDGMGYELLRGLRERGANVAYTIQAADRVTPTYSKPMMRETDGRIHELNRLDIKNRSPMDKATEERILSHLRELAGQVDGIIVADQVQERNCGVITDRVRTALNQLGSAYPEAVIAVDSRVRIGEFHNVILKPNAREAARAVFPDRTGESADRTATQREKVLASGRRLCQKNGRPVFITLGAEGVLVFEQSKTTHVPGVRVGGLIDIVGAGDSVMAGIASALCCGASPAEAAEIGNLVASITIQQIGTTGTATRDQVMARHADRRD